MPTSPRASSGSANGRQRGEKRRAPDDDEACGDEEHPPSACHSCRKRKAKCSRQQPCRQCVRLNVDCVYDDKRQKPGMRTGAIEALNQRLTALEQMFLGQGILLQPLLDQTHKFVETQASDVEGLATRTESLRRHLISTAQNQCLQDTADDNITIQRSQHFDSEPRPIEPASYSLSEFSLPSPEIVDHLVKLYFQQVHPWIPVLHISSFKSRMKDPSQREKLSTVLHAITSVCLRLDDSEYARSITDLKDYCLRCRHTVILRSMEAFSVHNLQALIIVAFDIIGSGRGPSAWSVVGSMARTVEQLQLSVEENVERYVETVRQSLISRVSFLKPPKSWIEAEERRRVFWTVFLMDRFCSVATGWNNSITGADVRRRLPCEGALWEVGNYVRTPYFGIAERSSASATVSNLTPSSERHATDEEEVDNIGGFAFCIEATESLNLVTTFFLRQAVNFDNPREIQIWLLRFRELDTRLVKWRLFLPSRWGDASAPNSDGNMDPNLALAHITHNTAVIQLHQGIAYPSPQWKSWSIGLPSSTSAETCVTAATEIRTIAQHYLRMSRGVVNPQFSFCLFVAGRVLLAHSVHHKASIPAAFDDIVSSLRLIAERWTRNKVDNGDNLASRFAIRLQQARTSIKGDAIPQHQSLLDIRKPVYSDEIRDSRPVTRRGSVQISTPNEQANISGPTSPQNGFSPESMSLAFPPLPLSLQQYPDPWQPNCGVQIHSSMANGTPQGNLISPSLMDSFDGITNIFDGQFQEVSYVSITDSGQFPAHHHSRCSGSAPMPGDLSNFLILLCL